MSKARNVNESAFDAWFHAQFGNRESGGATDAELSMALLDGIAASAEIAKRAEWDAQRKAALYAWATKERK